MLKPGVYMWVSKDRGIFGGYVKIRFKETEKSFILTLMENACRFGAPHIDDLFRNTDRLVIRKSGSQHALNVCDAFDDWFCLYPWRCGEPYAFQKV